MILADELTTEQVHLLKLVWEPVLLATSGEAFPDWPVWDFVERSLYRAHPDLGNAVDILATLPSVRSPLFAPIPRRAYGLIWHTGHIAMNPGAENRIGLTIAGLAALARHGVTTLPLADGLAAIIGAAAQADEAQEPQPFHAVKADVPLATYAAVLGAPARDRPYAFPARLVAEGLSQEYAPLSIHPLDGTEGHQLLLGRTSLRAYRGVTTAADYLACIDALETSHEAPIRYTSPLTLIQTLDYLGYVLAADEQWPKGLRLTAAPDLQSAAALSAEVETRGDYDTALSGLWNILDQLHTPDVPPEAVKARYNGQRPRSIGRLQYWLDQRLGDGASLARVTAALKVVRLVGRIRAEPQHGSAAVRQAALDARRQLGLSDVIQDHRATWNLILDQVAGAFDAVRQEVQRAGRPGR